MAGMDLPLLASLNDPQIAVDQAALQRQMALAQLLRQQAMTPLDISNRQIGGMGYKVSPLEGIAKVLQGYKASQMEKSTDESRLALSQREMAALKGLFPEKPDQTVQSPASAGLPAGVSSDQLASGGFPQPAPGQQAPPVAGPKQMGLAAVMRNAFLNSMSPPMATVDAQNYSTPEAIRTMDLTGQDRSAVGRATLGKLENEANAPHRLGGGAYGDARGNILGLPSAPLPGFATVNGPNGWSQVPMGNGTNAITQSEAAKAKGPLYAELLNNPKDAQGNPLPVQTKAEALGLPPLDGTTVTTGPNPQLNVPPDVQKKRDVDRRAILQKEFDNTTDPTDRALLKKDMASIPGTPKGGVYTETPLGTENQQKAIDKSWEKVQSVGSGAQTTKSFLTGVLNAAQKGAVIGPQYEKRELINGLLSVIGVDERATNDKVTQTNLVKKYSANIVATLSAAGMDTDAAREIAKSANPGQAMNLDAIKEVVPVLSGLSDMHQAKLNLLTGPYGDRKGKDYITKESQFDQLADPRIYQWKAIRDPAAQAAFAKQLQAQDPTMHDRIIKLEKMGAL